MTWPLFYQALAKGAEQVMSWSHLLDGINVFPVADGDTGRNLAVSLAPLRSGNTDTERFCRNLLLAARGNSGNIAVRFLQEFVKTPSFQGIILSVRQGRDQAYRAVIDPKPGTMLSLFDRLVDVCQELPAGAESEWPKPILAALETAVAYTVHGQPVLQKAGVVDAGALGMYLFFDGFFSIFAGAQPHFLPSRVSFKDNLRISDAFSREKAAGFCIDAVLECKTSQEPSLCFEGESAVVMRNGNYIKVHMHAADREKAKSELAAHARIVAWASDDLAVQTEVFHAGRPQSEVHIMTDAAGSITREDAGLLGVTLLDSYIHLGDTSLPETCCEPDAVYEAMRAGASCTTAQASHDERHNHYAGVLALHENVVYLCVGSAYTGNYQTALAWKLRCDHDGRFRVIDTGAASGRLAVAVYLAARFASRACSAAEVEDFVRTILGCCREYIFIDTLKYLAAGGRLSRSGAFLGDMVNIKPVISPEPDGARRVGTVRSRKDQLLFARSRISEAFGRTGGGFILFQYSDNRPWVEDFADSIRTYVPDAEILVRPLSLTTGVHTGPGSWGVSFAPEGI